MSARPLPRTRTRKPLRRLARGVMLIEALIAILIFSIGILGIVGLQASVVKQSTDARYRAEAAYLVDQLMGQMWSGDRTVATLQTQYNTCSSSACAGYKSWLAKVQSTLPSVELGTDTEPKVKVDANGVVTITVYWRPPSDENGGDLHRYDVEAQIGQ